MDRRASSSWDKTAFVREPLDRTLCRPRPSGSASENHSAAQDHDRLGQQRSPPTGGRGSHAHAGRLSPFWAIRPPCMSSCGHFSVRQESTSPGTVDHSWACDMAATNSNFNNGSDFSRCPTFRDAPDSDDSDSDASMDAEVASLTSGRRLGMDHKDASLLLGPRCVVRARAGYMPVVTPPSRNREAESVEAFFALLSSPTAEQHCSSSSSSSSSSTPSPTDGFSTPAAGHLVLGRSAALSLRGRGARLPGYSGRAGAGVGSGEVPANERGAKRQRFGASASASRCKNPI